MPMLLIYLKTKVTLCNTATAFFPLHLYKGRADYRISIKTLELSSDMFGKEEKNHFLIHMTDDTELHLCQPKADHVSV